MSEDAKPRQSLYNLQAEEATVACLLFDPDLREGDIAQDDFHDSELSRIVSLIYDMHARGEYVDPITVEDAAVVRGLAIDPIRLVKLQALDLDFAHGGAYASIVKECAKRRRIEDAAQRLVQAAYHANGTLADDVADIGAELARLSGQPQTARPALAVAPVPDMSTCPALPASAQLDPGLSAEASPWLDSYIAFSRQWAPRAYEGFHLSVGLWVLSTVAGRRVALDFGGKRYASLYMANLARSSVWTKSTAHHIGAELLEAAGLYFLLAPDEATPQALLHRMATPLTVTDWDAKPVQQQEQDALALAFAGQKGWDFDEFGTKVAAMMRESGVMADFRGLLRRLDDAPERYVYATVGRGDNVIQRPFLALLASMTPADMQPYAKRGGALWHDGFWARFAFMAPDPDAKPTMGRFPEGERIIPAELLQPLRHWHDRLRTPIVDLAPRKDAEGKTTNTHDVTVTAAPPQVCLLGRGVRDAFYAYHDALITLAAASNNQDLDGNYSRFAEKGLRVAMLLASLENNGVIELRHWARAQEVAECWRRSLHNLYRALNAGQDEAGRIEDRVIELVERLGSATPTDIHRYAPDLSTTDAAGVLEKLARAGALKPPERTHKRTLRYTIGES